MALIDDELRKKIGLLADTYMDVQDMRIRMENRVRQEEYDEAMRNFIKERAKTMKGIEEKLRKEMLIQLKSTPLFNNWLLYVKGVGPTLTAKILRYIDFEKAKHVSSLYAYAGLIVDDETGMAVKRQRGGKLGWNPKLKTTLYNLAVSIEKNGRGYRKLYDEFKREELAKARVVIDVKDVERYVGYIYEGKPITKKMAEKLKQGSGEIEVERAKAHIRMRVLRKVEKVFLGHLYIVHEWMDIRRAEVHYQGRKDGWIYMPVVDLTPEQMYAEGKFDWWFELKDAYKEMGIRPVVV